MNEIDNFWVHSNVTYSINISKIFGMKGLLMWTQEDAYKIHDVMAEPPPKATLYLFISIFKKRISYAKRIKYLSEIN